MHGSPNSQSTSHEGQHFSFFGLIRTLRYTCFKKYVHDLFSYKKAIPWYSEVNDMDKVH